MKFELFLCITAVVGAQASTAFAQGTAAAAEALFQQGRSDLAKGDYDSACTKLRQSDELDPGLGTKLNLADCEDKRGHSATAWELFKAVEDKLDPADPRQAFAKRQREVLEPKLPKLVLVPAPGAPSGTTVREGSAVIRSTAFGIALPLDPGRHQFTVSAPGRADATLSVLLESGKSTQLVVAPGAPTQPGVVPAAARPSGPMTVGIQSPDNTHGNRRDRTLASAFLSLGAAGLVVGGVGGILAISAKHTNDQHCNAALRTCDATGHDSAASGRTYGAVTTAGLAVGVVGLGLGTYFLVRGSKGSESKTALVTELGPAGHQLSLVHQW